MINQFSFRPSDEELKQIRSELYRSDAPGFFIFRKFINENFLNHMRSFWIHEAPISKSHVKLQGIDKKKMFWLGNPDYLYETRFGRAYYNYFWNKPVDEATYAVAFAVQQLRSLIESNKNHLDFYPLDGYCCSYRVVITRNGEKIVEPHSDWTTPPYFRPERLQATVILSKKGTDYNGIGMKTISNDKKTEYVFDSENMPLEPGDLVIWRYNNVHSVENVRSSEDQVGFLRMIFPPETILPRSEESVMSEIRASVLFKHLRKRILKRFKLSS
ncbi:MAG: hypothetical protein HY064_12030 [Bacteroidetes bacterium]|nr:hypothetical protein [Bacteroidota bacterium]